MKIQIIIGKNFGDEGKGLTVDYFALKAKENGEPCLVIRHNGGAQSGHTVDLPDKRFIFHQLSSGSFRAADTYWADTFMPDLYKLREEAGSFRGLHPQLPTIYGDANCRCVIIDDVLTNMALETARGDNRHGSCGMGINEAAVRSSEPDFRLTLGQIASMTAECLYHELLRIRKNYLPLRQNSLGLDLAKSGIYGELLSDDDVLYNAAEEMMRGLELITVTDHSIVTSYQRVIFECGQGLLLDEDYQKFAPHLTTSKTGCHNPVRFVKKHLDGHPVELVYVSRSYVTRHGRGPLPYEGMLDEKAYGFCDKTNLFNPWQENLRFAPHGSPSQFSEEVKRDTAGITVPHSASLMLTHLNETNGAVCSISGNVPYDKWFEADEIKNTFNRFYTSFTPFSEDIALFS